MAVKAQSGLNLDKVGAYASAICAVHCVLTGLAFGLLSVVGLGFIGSPTAEIAFIGVTLSVGTLAVVHGVRKHHSAIPALFYVAGLSALLISHFAFPHVHKEGVEDNLSAHLFSALGGICLVTFHILNQRKANQCGCNHCSTGE